MKGINSLSQKVMSWLWIIIDGINDRKQWIVFPAIYLTTVMCICGLSIVFQVVMFNFYHVYPVTEIPSWLKKMQALMSCNMSCASGSHGTEVLPYLGDNAHTDHADSHPNDGDKVDMRGTESKDGHMPMSTVKTRSMPDLDVIIKKIKIDEEEEKLRLGWKDFARSCDRLLLIIFVTIHLIILLIFLAFPTYLK